MERQLLFIFLNFFLIQNYGIAQNNMEWVKVEDNMLPTGSCNFASDCDAEKFCYALVFTPTFVDSNSGMESPENELIFSSYTTFFRIDCTADNTLSVTDNESCFMIDNSTETQVCPTIEQRFNSSANSGNQIFTKGSPYVIHTVCFQVQPGESITVEIREPPAQNVQSNSSLGLGASAITENLDVADLVIDYDAICGTLGIGDLNPNKSAGELYPNPSKSGFVNLDILSQKNEKITVSVYNLTGKLVANQIEQVSNGNNKLAFDFSNLGPGVYLIKIGNNRNAVLRKLVVKR